MVVVMALALALEPLPTLLTMEKDGNPGMAELLLVDDGGT